MPDEPLVCVTNHHPPTCGSPPQIDASTGQHYVGYFENAYGEQAVFVYDHPTQQGTLYLGDAGWEQPHPVSDGVVQDVRLTPHEQRWLRACWEAATASRRRPSAP